MVLRKLARSVAVFVAFAAVLGGVYWLGGAIRSSNLSSLRSSAKDATRAALRDTASTKSLRQAVYGQCHRQNVSRITGNRNNYAQYKLWSAALTVFQYGESQPSTGKTDPHGALLLTALLSAMTTQLHTESWTPLSDCEAATNHPITYVPPEAVPFSPSQPPPTSAFTIGPGE